MSSGAPFRGPPFGCVPQFSFREGGITLAAAGSLHHGSPSTVDIQERFSSSFVGAAYELQERWCAHRLAAAPDVKRAAEEKTETREARLQQVIPYRKEYVVY